MDTKTIMWVVMAIFTGSDGKKFARSDYCVTEFGAMEKEKFYKEYVGDILNVVKVYSLDDNGDLHLVSAWQPNKIVSEFDSMSVSNPNSIYIPLGGIVYIKSDDENTTGWYKKEYLNSKSVYRIENNYDKDFGHTFASNLIENNTKDNICPKITYIADIEDEGTLFGDFAELTSKFVVEVKSSLGDLYDDEEFD